MGLHPDAKMKARLFRDYRELSGRRCDLKDIAADDQLEIIDAGLSDPGWEACLVAGEHAGIIACRPGQHRGRRRFSIAHELAHFHLPSHQTKRAPRPCEDRDLDATKKYGSKQEWEANTFAAYLLMPGKLFGRDVREAPISFETARELAAPDAYDVSITAAARRLVEETSEHCALVATEDGRVIWQDRSEYYWSMPRKGDEIRPHTFAAGVYDGTPPNPVPETITPHHWINTPSDLPDDFLLVESTHHVPSQNQVLSLLWAPEYEEGYWS